MSPGERSMGVVPKLKFAERLSKSESRPDECQDCIAHAENIYALSDGATDAAYSEIWAEILVQEYCSSRPDLTEIESLQQWLETCRSRWRVREAEIRLGNLPYFTVEKLRGGSHATFLSLVVEQSPPRWQACAFGDTCAFVVSDDVLAEAFPITQTGAFGNTPSLIATSKLVKMPQFKVAAGAAKAGDQIYMATDALAEWFMRRNDLGLKPWNELEGHLSAGTFERFIRESRLDGSMRDDDVAVMSIEFAEGV